MRFYTGFPVEVMKVVISLFAVIWQKSNKKKIGTSDMNSKHMNTDSDREVMVNTARKTEGLKKTKTKQNDTK